MKFKRFSHRFFLPVAMILLVLVVSMVLLYQIFSTRVALEAANLLFEQKLTSEIEAYPLFLERFHGLIFRSGNELLDSRGVSLDGQFEFVDTLRELFGSEATLFVRDGQDFRRVITSIQRADGSRAVGTMLGIDSAAYGPVIAGERYLGRANILGLPYVTVYDPILSNTGEVDGIYFLGVTTAQVDQLISAQVQESLNIILLITILITILGLVLLGLTARISVRQLKTIAKRFTEISTGSGDLTQRIQNSSQDEVGTIAKGFNEFLSVLSTMIGSIRREAEELSEMGSEISVEMGQTSESAQLITQRIDQIQSQINRQAQELERNFENGTTIAAHINQLSQNIEQQTQAVTHSASAVEQMVASVQSVTQRLELNSQSSKDLEQVSRESSDTIYEFSGIVKTIATQSEGLIEANEIIQHIASQTNLLAMNAAIEAAHAGEQGKGFAVVADEIRKLAESASEQSQSISKVILDIQDSIQTALQRSDSVQEGMDSLNEGILEVRRSEEEIQFAMSEQTTAGSEVISYLHGLLEQNRSVHQGSEEMQKNSTEIIDTVNNLNEISQEVQTSIAEITREVQRIDGIIRKVSELSVRNRDTVTILAEEVSNFVIGD